MSSNRDARDEGVAVGGDGEGHGPCPSGEGGSRRDNNRHPNPDWQSHPRRKWFESLRGSSSKLGKP